MHQAIHGHAAAVKPTLSLPAPRAMASMPPFIFSLSLMVDYPAFSKISFPQKLLVAMEIMSDHFHTHIRWQVGPIELW
jgi:hypothetical protein